MVPPELLPLFTATRLAGGRAVLVGGCVRDHLLGRPIKDFDVEVHGMGAGALAELLRRLGPVNEVGRSFGVFKLRLAGHEVDVSAPRRDSRGGPGHRGIRVVSDATLDAREAARRRDLTINAISYDPLAREWIDPFDGRADLRERRLRAVDPTTFVEDPLRALRVVQFAARFGFDGDADLVALCARMPLGELPRERVWGEVEKLLLLGVEPSRGWAFARAAGVWARVVPEWDCPCPPDLDAVASRAPPEPDRRLALMLAACCTPAHVEAVLDCFALHRWRGTKLRTRVLSLVARRDEAARATERRDARRLAEGGILDLFALLADNDALHRMGRELGLLRAPGSALLDGTLLIAMGVAPGPELGSILGEARERQYEGALASRAGAVAWAAARLAR
jgi:tRNA nucleotidyltransferase (CCA-adding enzyme)